MTLARANLSCVVVRMYLERHSLIHRLKLQVGLCPARDEHRMGNCPSRAAYRSDNQGGFDASRGLSLRAEMHAPIRPPKTATSPNALIIPAAMPSA